MAKRKSTINKTELSNPLAKTAVPSAASNSGELPAEGRTIPIGVGLKEPEVAALDEIAEKYKVSRHSLMRYAIRHFIQEVWADRINLGEDVEEPETKNKLNMP